MRAVRATLAASMAFALVGAGGPPASSSDSMTQRAFIRSIRRSPLNRLLSGQARQGLRILTHASSQRPTDGEGAGSAASSPATAPTQAAPANVRVNDPSTDGAGDPDMTTQSEVDLAVSGSNIVAGYNDDGTSPRPGAESLSPATDYTGYSWSDDGGATWHDSELPNRAPTVNLGDPVLVTDRAGRFYFGELSVNVAAQRIDISVARSDDGGQTFSEPRVISSKAKFTMNDKPWMAVGPDPLDPTTDVIYAAWMEAYYDRAKGEDGTRIVLASSRDAGDTWSQPAEVFRQPSFRKGRSAYVNGSSLAVDPATGLVYLAWEQLVNPPHGQGKFAVRREMLVSSSDGGATFSAPVVVAHPSRIGELNGGCGDVMKFGPGRLIRDTEFPSVGVGPGGAVFLAYASKGAAGGAEVRVRSSVDGGASWGPATLVAQDDAFMPALSADDSGVTVVYYQRVSARRLKTAVATSTDGVTYAVEDLSSTSFEIPITFPNFDPGLAPCYMGDYLGVQRDAGTSYTSWGDTRDVVTNAFWPQGRPDPDIYFAEL